MKIEQAKAYWRCQNCNDLTLHIIRKSPTSLKFTCTECGLVVEHIASVEVKA